MSMRAVVESQLPVGADLTVEGAVALVIADRIDGGLTGAPLAAVIPQLRSIMRDLAAPVGDDPVADVQAEIEGERVKLKLVAG